MVFYIFTKLKRWLDEIFGFGEKVEDFAQSKRKRRWKEKKRRRKERLKQRRKKIKFIFKGFDVDFTDHIERGHIKITIKHAQIEDEIAETYRYTTGKGGKEASEIQPPWQVKKKITGIHTHKFIDGELIRIKKILETKTLHTGEKVHLVEIDVFVKELNKFSKKAKKSTLWPKEWGTEKIKQITKEASENIFEIRGRKHRGISKEGYEVEFFSEKKGIIDNAYLYTENLK